MGFLQSSAHCLPNIAVLLPLQKAIFWAWMNPREICWVSVYFFQNRIMNTSASKKSKVAQRNQRQRVVP